MRTMRSGGEMSVTICAWMWEPEGLDLGHGADLIVYAALFDLTDAGTGVYARPCSELARLLGYSRETVQRSLTHLMKRGVVWSPDGRTSSSGTPRTYAISPGPLERARKAMGIEVSMAPIATMPSATGAAAGNAGGSICAVVSPQPVTIPGCDAFAEAGRSTVVTGTATCDHMSVVRPAAVENLPVTMPACDGPSQAARPGCDTASQPSATCDDASRGVTGTCDDMMRAGCAPSSRPTDRHTPENDVLPAETSVFDTAHIRSYLLSPDMPDTTDGTVDTRWSQGTQMSLPIDVAIDAAPQGPGSTLTSAEIAAFEALVTHALLPVDDAFLGRNLAAFERIVASGIPADAIVEAYDDYADYQRSRYQQSGTWRPMHLLRWLEMSPNGNIAYVMRRRELQAQRSGMAGATGTAGVPAPGFDRDVADGRQAPSAPVRRRGPRLTLCRDRGRALWFVDDDHGSRRVEGAEGVEDTAMAKRIYEQMYARECRDAMRAA